MDKTLFDYVMDSIPDISQREDFMHGDWFEYDSDKALPEDVTHELIENYGGEDCGSEYYSVWKFTRGEDECFVRFEGFYASFHGADYEDAFEVFPKEVTRTEYAKK